MMIICLKWNVEERENSATFWKLKFGVSLHTSKNSIGTGAVNGPFFFFFFFFFCHAQEPCTRAHVLMACNSIALTKPQHPPKMHSFSQLLDEMMKEKFWKTRGTKNNPG